ncbi:AAA family ATPase [bacterium]|nr:AAA family ATPase [bacterium]
MPKAVNSSNVPPQVIARQRQPAEELYAAELLALQAIDRQEKPIGWSLSPRAVRDFICGIDKPIDGPNGPVPIIRKFFGDDALVERAIITLATERGLMLIGEPGTAKSLLSELLSAAVSGSSLLTIQGSAATTEDQIRYSWNYALLLAKGPSIESLVPAPLYLGMSRGRVVRFEEITRCPLEVQDVIVPILSERLMVIAELEGDAGTVYARPGFNIIATANTRDRGVNEMSAALKRRFHFETVPAISDLEEELELVHREVKRQLEGLMIPMKVDRDVIALLVQTFHELRAGRTVEGTPLAQPSSVLSTAEAVSVGVSASLHARFYGVGELRPKHLVEHLTGSAAKEPDDRKSLANYFQLAAKERASSNKLWKEYEEAGRSIAGEKLVRKKKS